MTTSTEHYDEEFHDDYLLPIPCAVNYPVNITVDIFIENTVGRSSPVGSNLSSVYLKFNFQVSKTKTTHLSLCLMQQSSGKRSNETSLQSFENCPTVDCYFTDICINFGEMKGKIKPSDCLRRGMTIKCYSYQRSEVDSVQIKIESSSGIKLVFTADLLHSTKSYPNFSNSYFTFTK